jgi:isopenicillin-N N-acyltransferase-like protein
MGSAPGDVAPGFPVVEAEGAPYELGRAHGRQCAELITRFARVGMPQYLGCAPEEMVRAVGDELPAYARAVGAAAPHLLEEIRGIADGAGVSFEEALVLQLRPELGYVRRRRKEACTSAGVRAIRSRAGTPLIAQNVDMALELLEYGVMLRLRPRSGPAILAWTLAGVVGQTGINSWGLGRCGNVVMSPGWRVGVPTAILFRLALEQRTVEDVAALCARLPRAKSNNFLLCDGGDRVACLELTVDDQRLLEPGPDEVVVHANHYQHPDLVPADVGPYGEGSRLRQKRMAELAGGGGPIGEVELQAFLGDHANAPHSICGHGAPGLQTIAGCVLNPGEGRLWVSRGNPCVAGYRPYTLAAPSG